MSSPPPLSLSSVIPLPWKQNWFIENNMTNNNLSSIGDYFVF